jgi:hypothetical protein
VTVATNVQDLIAQATEAAPFLNWMNADFLPFDGEPGSVTVIASTQYPGTAVGVVAHESGLFSASVLSGSRHEKAMLWVSTKHPDARRAIYEALRLFFYTKPHRPDDDKVTP